MSPHFGWQVYANIYDPTVGDRIRPGGNNLIDGPLDEVDKQQAMSKFG